MSNSPNYLSDRPEIKENPAIPFHMNPEVDVLTDVLLSFKLRGSVFCRSLMRAPWSLSVSDDGQAHFHYIERGMCQLEIEGKEKTYTLERGDLAVLPHGCGHRMYHGSDIESVSIDELSEKTPKIEACKLIEFGGDGPETRMLCGAFQFNSLQNGLLKPLLPDTILLSDRSSESYSILESTLRLIRIEAGNNLPGAEIVLSNLVSILLVQVLRFWIDQKPQDHSTHWLRGLKDKRILTALSYIHTHPEYKWTVEKLAACIHMSRSPFAARFKLLVGETPMAYLGKWRIIKATKMLEDTELGLSEIASNVGYQSVPSFSKVFKNHTGYAPGQWRSRKADASEHSRLQKSPRL